MHPYENAESYVGQQSRDADEVITSAPPLPGIPAAWETEDTWTGEEPAPDAPPDSDPEPDAEVLRRRVAQLQTALENERENSRRHLARAEAAERRVDEVVTIDAELSARLKDASERIVNMERRLDQQREYWRGQRSEWSIEREKLELRIETERERADSSARWFRSFLLKVLGHFPTWALQHVIDSRISQSPVAGVGSAVPTAAVPVAGDDTSNDARQDAS